MNNDNPNQLDYTTVRQNTTSYTANEAISKTRIRNMVIISNSVFNTRDVLHVCSNLYDDFEMGSLRRSNDLTVMTRFMAD